MEVYIDNKSTDNQVSKLFALNMKNSYLGHVSNSLIKNH